MKSTYIKLQTFFDKLVNLALKVYGSALTFILALICVIVFLTDRVFYKESLHDMIRDSIMCITFLSFFIIQKAFNKYAAAIHLKINELVVSHEKARNEVINVENKTEEELRELSKNYIQHVSDNTRSNTSQAENG